MNVKSDIKLPILLSAAVAIAMSGCAPKRTCSVAVPKVVQHVSHHSMMDDKDKKIHALELAILDAKRHAGKTITKVVTVPSSSGDDYPPNAQPGKCYKKVIIPAKFELRTEKVLAKDAGERITIIPAKYKMVTKKVMVKGPSEKLVVIPATYKTVTEKVLVREAGERLVNIPAKYKTVTEKILVKDATTAWRKGCSNGTGSCDTLCLVNLPAQYRTITKRVLVTPATTKSIPIPAVYKTVTKKVIDRPATTKVIPVPPVYRTVTTRELVQPATVKKTTIPPTYQTVTKRVKVSESSMKWVESACQHSYSSEPEVVSTPVSSVATVDIKSLQRALKSAGFNPGPIDGIVGRRTKYALHRYQKAHGLSIGGISDETLASLGI